MSAERREFRAWINNHCGRLSRKELRKLYSAPDILCKKQILTEIEEREIEAKEKARREKEKREQARRNTPPLTPVQQIFGMLNALSEDMPYSPVAEALRKDIEKDLPSE